MLTVYWEKSWPLILISFIIWSCQCKQMLQNTLFLAIIHIFSLCLRAFLFFVVQYTWKMMDPVLLSHCQPLQQLKNWQKHNSDISGHYFSDLLTSGQNKTNGPNWDFGYPLTMTCTGAMKKFCLRSLTTSYCRMVCGYTMVSKKKGWWKS